MSDLFAPQMSKEMAERRPLADRLRPKNLAEVTGQEHLTGEDGVLARMIASGSLGSMSSFSHGSISQPSTRAHSGGLVFGVRAGGGEMLEALDDLGIDVVGPVLHHADALLPVLPTGIGAADRVAVRMC